MMKIPPTKGPWEAFALKNLDGWWAVRQVSSKYELGSSDGGFDEVDARLMAAAPDLLAALVEMNEQYTILLRDCMEPPHKHLAEKAPEIRAALAAIAKATGAA